MSKTNPLTIFNQIDAYCEALGWSPADLAHATGIDRQTTWRFLNGHADTSTEKAQLMLDTLNEHASVTITLDLPKVLAHNDGKHWREKAKIIEGYRQTAMALTLQAQATLMKKATLSYRFFFPNRAVRDEANYVHACKPYVDGVVDAGLIPDDRWTILGTGTVTSAVSKTNPRVELVFTPVFFN